MKTLKPDQSRRKWKRDTQFARGILNNVRIFSVNPARKLSRKKRREEDRQLRRAFYDISRIKLLSADVKTDKDTGFQFMHTKVEEKGMLREVYSLMYGSGAEGINHTLSLV